LTFAGSEGANAAGQVGILSSPAIPFAVAGNLEYGEFST
jgi:hypothetical protein